MKSKYLSLIAVPLLGIACSLAVRADQPPAATPPPASVSSSGPSGPSGTTTAMASRPPA